MHACMFVSVLVFCGMVWYVWYAMVCYGVLWYEMLWNDYACFVWFAMVCYGMLYHGMLRYVLLCDVTVCYVCVLLCYVMFCYALLPCFAMPCFSMLCCAVPCYAILCYVLLCYAMLCMSVCMLVCTYERMCICTYVCIQSSSCLWRDLMSADSSPWSFSNSASKLFSALCNCALRTLPGRFRDVLIFFSSATGDFDRGDLDRASTRPTGSVPSRRGGMLCSVGCVRNFLIVTKHVCIVRCYSGYVI